MPVSLRRRCSFCRVAYWGAPSIVDGICPRCVKVARKAVRFGQTIRDAVRKDMSTMAGIAARVDIALRARSDAPPMSEAEVFRNLTEPPDAA